MSHDSELVDHGPARRLDELLDEYRDHLRHSLDDLTDDEARLRLVPSKTTLLGLLKHVTGDRPVWALQIQVLRELAQHAGHADILREQILAARI